MDTPRSACGLVRRQVLASLTAIGLMGYLHPAEAATLRLASLAPTGSPWGRLIRSLARTVKKDSEGAVQLKLFLDGKLGDESKVAKKLGRGLDGAFLTGQGMGLLLPLFRVQELPFLAESYEEADKVRAVLWPLFEKAFEADTKFKLMAQGETGLVHLFSQTSITTTEGLRKSKIWVWEGDHVASATLKTFGVSPHPLDILTVVQQLKTGGINTVYASPAGAVALGWTGDLRYVVEQPFAYASGGLVLTKRAWKKIPAPQRPRIEKIMQAFGKQMIQQARKDNQAILQKLIGPGGGLKKASINAAHYKSLKAMAARAWPQLADKLGAAPLLAKARTIVGK